MIQVDIINVCKQILQIDGDGGMDHAYTVNIQLSSKRCVYAEHIKHNMFVSKTSYRLLNFISSGCMNAFQIV